MQLTEQQVRDEESRQHEEQVDAQESTAQLIDARVVEHNGNDRQSAQSLNVAAMAEWRTRRSQTSHWAWSS